MNARLIPGLSAGIFLVVVGAVLRFGITADLEGVDLDVIGQIMIVGGFVVGAIGLITGLFDSIKSTKVERRDTVSHTDSGTVREYEKTIS